MKLGFFTMPIHPLGKDWRVSLQEDREAFVLADELGFTEAYVGEHVTDTAETVTDCVVFLASLAFETKNIMLCTGTVNLANTHPAAVATKVAMLDNITRGRVIIQGQANATAGRFPWIPWIPRSLGWHVIAQAGTVKIATRC